MRSLNWFLFHIRTLGSVFWATDLYFVCSNVALYIALLTWPSNSSPDLLYMKVVCIFSSIVLSVTQDVALQKQKNSFQYRELEHPNDNYDIWFARFLDYSETIPSLFTPNSSIRHAVSVSILRQSQSLASSLMAGLHNIFSQFLRKNPWKVLQYFGCMLLLGVFTIWDYFRAATSPGSPTLMLKQQTQRLRISSRTLDWSRIRPATGLAKTYNSPPIAHAHVYLHGNCTKDPGIDLFLYWCQEALDFTSRNWHVYYLRVSAFDCRAYFVRGLPYSQHPLLEW